MQNKRRQFLRNAALVSLAFPLLQSCKGEKKETTATVDPATAKFTLDKYGIQLWSVRDDMAKDPKATLKALADFGYNQIESFQGDKGVFWGMKATEYSEYIKSLGMDLYGAHCNPAYAMDLKLRDEFKKLADDAASIGMKYLINPYVGFLKKKDEFKKAAEGFNELGTICKERGLKYGYHNHHYSFQKLEDEFPQDIMMNGTNADLVDFEMDIYWVVTAGQNPIDWLKKYPGRFKMGHIKDRFKQARIDEITKTEKANPDFGIDGSCVLGTGQINFDEVLKVAKDQGMQYYIVEQERWDNSTPLADAGKDAAYMKKFKA
jgi:sugar phosphate isomerase/epimerase